MNAFAILRQCMADTPPTHPDYAAIQRRWQRTDPDALHRRWQHIGDRLRVSTRLRRAWMQLEDKAFRAYKKSLR